MNINSSYNNFNNISSLFNTLHQGKVQMFAVQLSNSKFLFPENKAPGAGTVGTDTVSYISDLKTSSKDLSDALRALSGPAFNQRSIISSNNEAMSVKYTGNNPGSIGEMQVKIDQVATGQLNEGTQLRSSGSYAGDRGVNRFAVDIGGKSTQLQISVSVTDTNRDVQNKMANAINDAGLGLRATVETDAKTGTSMLRIEQQTTGSDAKNEFSLRDVTGNAVASTGADNRTRQGQDAIYSINGGPAQTSSSNTVTLASGLTATFKVAADDAITVSRGRDTSAAVSAVRDMVSGFNRLFGTAAGNSDPKAQALASRMMNVFSVYSNSLSSVGIGINSEGRMTIDSERLNRAAEDGSLERLFTQDSGRNFGIVNQFSRIANDVFNNTGNFVSNSMFGSPSDLFGYPGFSNPAQANALRAGSIFDYQF